MSSRSLSPTPAASAGTSALVLALLLAGCSGGEGSPDPDSVTTAAATPAATADEEPPPTPAGGPGPDDVQYVALGDSYAAAPGVPRTDQADGCFRSDSNYAHVLAEAANLYLTDVTCSGATSEDVVDLQVPSLSVDTDLVTIGTGGNDFGLFTTILRSCISFGGGELTGTPCTEALNSQIEQVGPSIEAGVGAALDAVTTAAPNAQVYVVGYPALLPEAGTCPRLAPFAAADYPLLNTIVSGLSDALESAAEKRNLPFVDVQAASTGHDVCSEDPWINGAGVAPDGTIPFHPLAAEQAAVADLIGDML
ncbi:MAG: SGNH/GDSL hydrolase family protein [Nocardioides sp.]